MKKICVMIVTVVLMCTALTGCSNTFKSDDTHATISLTTSSGDASVWRSVNGAGKTISGQEIALMNKSEIILKKGNTAIVKFECEACGNEQEFEVKEAWAETISCDCPVEIDEKGNAKEYVAISISFEEE